MKKVNALVVILMVVSLITILPNPTLSVEAAETGYGSNGKFLAPIEASVAGSIAISDRAGLEAIKNNLNGNYHLTANIDLAGAEWVPIGDGSYFGRFSGTFDGQGYVISNLKITGNGYENNGLFGGTDRATIKNVGLENTQINVTGSAGANAGGICGSSSGSISNCYNTGEISLSSSVGEAFAGGICGGGSASISNCYNTGSVSASSSSKSASAGGIGGYVASSFENCYNTGNVSASSNPCNQSSASAGGICGFLRGSTFFKYCFNN